MMIVPRHWAEARVQHKEPGRQVTVRRFGWSNDSLEAAEINAQARAGDALRAILSGAKKPRRERKVPYNGAEGLPIREEIVMEHADLDAVITRNSYGALCLNTPDILFADLDIGTDLPWWQTFGPPVAIFVLCAGISGEDLNVGLAMALFVFSLLLGVWVSTLIDGFLGKLPSVAKNRRSQRQSRLIRRVHRFVERRPDWHLRIYFTPAGCRLLVLHRTFDPSEPEVAAFFQAVGADRQYVRMCLRQHCFRARLTAKPWRIGIQDHLKPRPGVWPVRPGKMPGRNAWLADYDAKAANFAACRFERELGSGRRDEKAARIQALHDDACRALTGLPLA